jgi:uncharacterized membrane protein
MSTPFVLSLVVLTTGCAGLIGPPFDLDPDFNGLATLGVMVLIALVAYRLFSRRISDPAGKTRAFSPLDIAKQRYARGEITRDEYQCLVKDLS